MTWTSDSRSLSRSSGLGSGEYPTASGFRVSLLLEESLRRAFSISSVVAEHKNAMRLLSGDQTGFEVPFGRAVRTRASPPAKVSTAIWDGLGLPVSSLSPPRTKA